MSYLIVSLGILVILDTLSALVQETLVNFSMTQIKERGTLIYSLMIEFESCSNEGRVRKVLKVEPLPDGSGHFFNLSNPLQPLMISIAAC